MTPSKKNRMCNKQQPDMKPDQRPQVTDQQRQNAQKAEGCVAWRSLTKGSKTISEQEGLHGGQEAGPGETVLVILGSLHFHMNFRISLLISAERQLEF